MSLNFPSITAVPFQSGAGLETRRNKKYYMIDATKALKETL